MVGTKRKATPVDVRNEVLAVALRLFAARGFDGTALQDIADAVGVRKQTLLHYFPSKEDLRKSVLEQMLAHWRDVFPRLLLAATAGEHRFDAVTQELVTFFKTDPDRARLLIREVLDRPEEMRDLLGTHLRPWVTALADYIRKGQRHGEHYADADPEAYLIHILGMFVGAIALADTMHVLLGSTRDDPSTNHRHLRELLRIAKSSLFSPARGDS
jgi:AcrR family transcriptional regulator